MDVGLLLDSWYRDLRASRSPATVRTYSGAGRVFLRWLGPRASDSVTRDTMRDFIGERGTQVSATTLSIEVRALRVFLKWAASEGDLPVVPVVPLPRIRLVPPHVLTSEEVSRLVRACEGRRLIDVRDMALLRVFLSTGARRSEVCYMRVEDVLLDDALLLLHGKGGRDRYVPITSQTVSAIDRYLRRRNSSSERLWLGQRSPLTDGGLYQCLRERARLAGIEGFHPHLLRHLFAAKWLSAGGQEIDLMQIAGWTSVSMLSRYARATASERAIASFRNLPMG